MNTFFKFASSLVVLGLVGCAANSDTTGESNAAIENASAGNWLSAAITPSSVAGVDISGGAEWPGATLESVAATLGAPTEQSEDDTTTTYAWGANSELNIGVLKTTNRVNFVQLNPGYQGKLEARSRVGGPFGQHTYSIAAGAPVLRDGATWAVDWSDRAQRAAAITELHSAFTATFAPDLTANETDCAAARECLSGSFPTFGEDGETETGTQIAVGSRITHLYLSWMIPTGGSAASAATTFLYMFPAKPGFVPPPPPPPPVNNRGGRNAG